MHRGDRGDEGLKALAKEKDSSLLEEFSSIPYTDSEQECSLNANVIKNTTRTKGQTVGNKL